MKTEKNILIAFILNLSFSIFEFVGGFLTGSVAIISDAVHDVGDALSIALSYFLEKKSKREPDATHTFGYARYSIIGGFITTLVLFVGSIFTIINAIHRIIIPTEINYNGMIAFAILGVCVNFGAALITHGEGSLNQKAVNLHMLEDVLGWIVVLVGAIVMKFTNFTLLDPLMSIGVSTFILIHAIGNLREVGNLFLEKVPTDINVSTIKEHIEGIPGIYDVHHIHIWNLDGRNHFATMHIVTDRPQHQVKEEVRLELQEYGIYHVTLELETTDEHCHEKQCLIQASPHTEHQHHHHHHG